MLILCQAGSNMLQVHGQRRVTPTLAPPHVTARSLQGNEIDDKHMERTHVIAF